MGWLVPARRMHGSSWVVRAGRNHSAPLGWGVLPTKCCLCGCPAVMGDAKAIGEAMLESQEVGPDRLTL